MPLTTRVIACLDVADGRVVKGTKFKDLKDSGDPVELANRYYADGIDELTLLDVHASVQERSTMLDLVQQTAEQVFIPLTVGGGIRTSDEVAQLLAAGADKVSIASAAIDNPDLISEIADRFGSQVLVLSLDLKSNKEAPSGYAVTSHGGTVPTGMDALTWIERVQNLGAGELLVNSIDRDGTGLGFDLEMLKDIVAISRVPIIASGGAGSPDDFVEGAKAGADALLAAGIFHRAEVSVSGVKRALSSAGFAVRKAN